MDTEEILYDLIRRSTLRPRPVIGGETRFRKDLKMDSFDFLNLVLRIEARFRCRLDDDILAGVVTVGQLALLLTDTLAAKTEENHV